MSDLPGMRVLPLHARHALRPRRNLPNIAITVGSCCLLWQETHRLPLFLITRLHRFTLSHCGSRTPCPTLKPNLAALAPRTRYRLLAKLYRAGSFTQLYYTHRTGALLRQVYHTHTRFASVSNALQTLQQPLKRILKFMDKTGAPSEQINAFVRWSTSASKHIINYMVHALIKITVVPNIFVDKAASYCVG